MRLDVTNDLKNLTLERKEKQKRKCIKLKRVLTSITVKLKLSFSCIINKILKIFVL